jgi:DNA-binding transcriptional LysR family regulator
MKLRQLDFVRAVAQSGSFSKAAEQCCATQPTLSNAIAQLEEELGGKLFDRTTRKVELTAFGSFLLSRIEAVLDAEREVLQSARSYLNPEHKLLRIGFSPLVDMGLLNHILQPFCHKYQDVEFFFKECLLDDLSERLNQDVIDLVILPSTMIPEGYRACPFYEDDLFYIPRDGSDLGPKAGDLLLDDLPDDPIIMTGGGCGLNGSLEALFAQEQAPLPTYRGQAISYSVIEEWTDLGIGAGILPQAKLTQSRSKANLLRLKDGSAARFDFCWLWPHSAASRPHISDFIAYIGSVVPSLIAGSAEVAPMRSKRSV